MAHTATVRGVGVGAGDGSRTTPAVILEARDEWLPIFVTPDQAQSMQFAMEGLPFERPLTHDLFVEMLSEFGGAIDRVRVDDLADDTFYAKIDAEQYHGGERQKIVFDARPSDAIAIALRVDCDIVVDEQVLEKAGQPLESADFDAFGPDDGQGF